jgi:hypothetical protein
MYKVLYIPLLILLTACNSSKKQQVTTVHDTIAVAGTVPAIPRANAENDSLTFIPVCYISSYTFQTGKWISIAENVLSYYVSGRNDDLQSIIVMKDSIPFFYEDSRSAGQRL